MAGRGRRRSPGPALLVTVLLGLLTAAAVLMQIPGCRARIAALSGRLDAGAIASGVRARFTAAFTGGKAAPEETEYGTLEMHVLDCGQADCILLLQDGHAMLVDAGEPENGQMIADYLEAQGVERLECLVLTHPHSDHIGGAAAVIDRIPVQSVLLSHAPHASGLYEELISSLEASGAEMRTACPGDVYTLGGAEYTVLSPDPGETYEDMNDYSVCLRMTFEGLSVLLTGDMGKIPEEEILARGYDADCDVLKASHHGSATASAREFIEAASPAVIVMTVEAGSDDNLPNADTLALYEESGAALFRSDEDGLIVLRLDAGEISVGTERR